MPLLTTFAASCGFLGVALGAFGAHGLEGRLDAKAAGWWETASFYLLLHAVAALAIALSGREGLGGAGGWCLAAGAALAVGRSWTNRSSRRHRVGGPVRPPRTPAAAAPATAGAAPPPPVP